VLITFSGSALIDVYEQALANIFYTNDGERGEDTAAARMLLLLLLRLLLLLLPGPAKLVAPAIVTAYASSLREQPSSLQSGLIVLMLTRMYSSPVQNRSRLLGPGPSRSQLLALPARSPVGFSRSMSIC